MEGYRTRQRELILEYLQNSQGHHLCPEEILEYLKDKGSPVGRSTVYRFLERLVEQGKVRKYYLGEGQGACYQYAQGQDCQEHFHLKCVECGSLIHVQCDYLNQISRHVLEHHGFTIDHTKTVLYGLCAQCAAGKKEAAD